MTLSLWQWILLACALAFVTKLLGYSLPERWMRSPRMAQVALVPAPELPQALGVKDRVFGHGADPC